MATTYPKTFKYCATCTFWMGNRECDHFGQRVTVPGSSEKGRCAIPKGGWRNFEKQASSQCTSWQKWSVLR